MGFWRLNLTYPTHRSSQKYLVGTWLQMVGMFKQLIVLKNIEIYDRMVKLHRNLTFDDTWAMKTTEILLCFLASPSLEDRLDVKNLDCEPLLNRAPQLSADWYFLHLSNLQLALWWPACKQLKHNQFFYLVNSGLYRNRMFDFAEDTQFLRTSITIERLVDMSAWCCRKSN